MVKDFSLRGHVVEVVLKAGPSRKDVELEEEEEDHVPLKKKKNGPT